MKKEINVGGRPRHNKKVKVHKSIRIDPDLVKKIQKFLPDLSLSLAIETLLKKVS